MTTAADRRQAVTARLVATRDRLEKELERLRASVVSERWIVQGSTRPGHWVDMAPLEEGLSPEERQEQLSRYRESAPRMNWRLIKRTTSEEEVEG